MRNPNEPRFPSHFAGFLTNLNSNAFSVAFRQQHACECINEVAGLLFVSGAGQCLLHQPQDRFAAIWFVGLRGCPLINFIQDCRWPQHPDVNALAGPMRPVRFADGASRRVHKRTGTV